ncbi:MAG: glycosyltransferase family 39 protein [Scytonema sp. PMC 1069.18]|nr:glycosyltransferase family 39 protein [Scytonema sp. PMC 1069.18]MEC4885375.1 glycosyltransferase family 39 protein [Scytonema sp. PMC 1070.18]
MIEQKRKRSQFKSLLILGVIWLLGALCDRIWLTLDRSTPGWDQADYLTGTLNYWQALQNPQWLNPEWWQGLWLLSSKIPPLTYILTAFVQNIFGTGPDEASLVMLLFSAILLGSVYGLGKVLFGESIGLWAAGLCQLFPALYQFRLTFLLDYPLAAVVTLSFFCLTAWRSTLTGVGVQGCRGVGEKTTLHPPIFPSLLWAVIFGLSFGMAVMVKQTALLFLLTPIVWVGVGALKNRHWGRLAQLLGSFCVSLLVFGSWYRTNWLFILTSGKRATIDSAIAEGDAPLNTLQAWTYYWQQLPYQISLPLLLIPIFCLLLHWGLSSKDSKTKNFPTPYTSHLIWLTVFLVGAYLLSSLNMNKDSRYVLPYLPVLSVVFAYGLTRFSNMRGQRIRWGTVGLAVILMLLNLFPLGGFIGGWFTHALSPSAQYFPDMKQELPHTQVISEIIQTEPYLRSTLGVLPSTEAINQHNFNYYGALRNFQVYGRQVGTRKNFVDKDVRSLEWFLTKTGNQGSVPKTQSTTVNTVEKGGDFQLRKSWKLPDDSVLKLYHHKIPTIEVKPVTGTGQTPAKITLSKVIVPEQAPPGVPVPVIYEWSGSWDELQHGLVILTWRHLTPVGTKGVASPHPTPHSSLSWIHDHGIAMGNLHSGDKKPEGTFQVTERLAMLPTPDLVPGTYSLEAIYLNRKSGESYPIQVPNITLQIAPQAIAQPAPELDLLTQLRTLGARLPQGAKVIDRIFDEVGRINQYDPTQDYLVQARLTLEYRLQNFTPEPALAYSLALANVLQRRVDGAIASLQQVTQLDRENPYAYAYLAFVQLYNWEPKAAQKSLEPGLAKNPTLQELNILSGVATLMQGNLIKAWQTFQTVYSMQRSSTL